MADVQPVIIYSTQPRVSVCIAHYKGTDILRDCLDSVLGQFCEFPIEVIVHDDASDPAALMMLERDYPMVRVIASDENVGFCRANNRMVDQAQGEYILLLNNDAALYQGALEALSIAADSSPESILSLPQYDWNTGELVDLGCLLDPFYNPVPNRNFARTEVAMVIGACLWIKKKVWLELGGFPEWMGSIGEDIYLCCLARLTGRTINVVPTSAYRHRQGYSFGGNKPNSTGQLQTTYRRRRLSEINKTWVLVLMTPTALTWLLLGTHVAFLLLEGIILSILTGSFRTFTLIYWPTAKAVFSKPWSTIQKRREIQCRRSLSLQSFLSCFTATPRKAAMLFSYGIPAISQSEKP